MIVSITLFSLIIVVAFAALSGIGMSRYRITDSLDMNQDIYYAVEKFVALVKEGGTIDYEEYWNRSSFDTTIGSGHYSQSTGFGNFGNGGTPGTATYGSSNYYCRSEDSTSSGIM